MGIIRGVTSELPLLELVLAPLLIDNTKLLIAGSADPGLFAAIGQISGSFSPAVTVIDKCRAPLQLIQEFAEARAVSCRTLHMDILELDGSERWENILLHYTMDFVEFSDRRKFFKRLMGSLSPGGKLICIAKTNQRGAPTDEARLEHAFLANAKNAIKDSSLKPLLHDNQFERMLHAYGKAATARRVRMTPAQELKRLLTSSGFAIAKEYTAQRETIIREDPDERESMFKGSVEITIIVAVRDASNRPL
ncbi:MAG: class I SAM-dependent methyltransferase [Lysobacterales bacterium]|nr:MAG: class I SAM-dependent methyltransferase [Xanthomonadales bacterium]